MSDSQQKSWSGNPNAPSISSGLYFAEKAWFAGNLIGSMFYGIVVVVFFQCLTALFSPIHRRGDPINWEVVSYTVVMFSLVTIEIATQLHIQSLSYIDNRGFPGGDGVSSSGPYGYQRHIDPKAISVAQGVAFVLNNWLADGLLLYRCYVIYSRKLWIVTFPCVVYLSSLVMGVMYIYQEVHLIDRQRWSDLPYFSISLSLNVLLTLMIIVRLTLISKYAFNAREGSRIGGLYKAIVVMLLESCALYAVNSLLVIVPWGAENDIWNFFLATLPETQVIAPLLIIKKVADRDSLTNNTPVPERISSFKARTRGKSMGSSGFQTMDVDSHQERSNLSVLGV